MNKILVLALGAMLLSIGSTVTVAETTPVEAHTNQLVQPTYPALARNKQITGHVVVEYTVNDQGKAENIRVVEAKPRRVFEEAAIEAIEQSNFNSNSAESRQQRFVFDIAGL